MRSNPQNDGATERSLAVGATPPLAPAESKIVFLNLDQVKLRVGNKSTTWVYEKMKRDFPRPVRYAGSRSVVWIESEIEAWMHAQVEASRAPA